MEAFGIAEAANEIACCAHRAWDDAEFAGSCSCGAFTVNPDVFAVVVFE